MMGNIGKSRMDYNPEGSAYTQPVKTKYKPYQYIYGTPEENAEKTARLKALAQMDPGIGQQIAEYTNQMMGSAGLVAGGGPNKDLYALGQDEYLRRYGGLRSAHQRARR
jgi:hypothetical protein